MKSKIISLALNYPLYIVSHFFPAKKNRWLFGAWYGRKYFDNSKFLFQYVTEHHPEIDAWWLTSDKLVFEQYKSKMRIAYKYSLKGVFLALTSSTNVVTHSVQVDLFPFANSRNRLSVLLWHGIPIKKIGFDDKYGYGRKSILKKIKNALFPFEKDSFSLIISSSEDDQNKMQSAFRANTETVKITGYPRNDILSKISQHNPDKILYAPTLRDGIDNDVDLFTHYRFDAKKMNDFLKSQNMFLDIKMHPMNNLSPNIERSIQQHDRINVLKSMIEINDRLSEYKMVISDYSGLYIDYLLTERPIIFAPFDYDKYKKKDRELYYNYDDVTPGPKCKNWDEVIEWMQTFLDNNSFFKAERQRTKRQFHKFDDGQNSARVLNEILKLQADRH